MKKSNLNFMSKVILLFLLLAGISNGIISQTKETIKSDGFLILIETTNETIKLTSQKGCAWKELSFTLNVNEIKSIDQFGVTPMKNVQKNKESTGDNNGNFHFTIKRVGNGLSFEGLKGTTWKKLSYSCTVAKCEHLIEAHGISKAE